MQPSQMLQAPKKNVWLWLALGAAAVAALSVAFYFYYAAYTPTDLGPIGGTTSEEADLAALESELQMESLDDLDSELMDIEKELAQ